MKNTLLLAASLFATSLLLTNPALAQRNFGTPNNLPTEPTPAAIPQITPNTGPDPWFDSSRGQWPGRDMTHYNYVVDEYVISGTADGEPYETRLVVRRPQDMDRFSGLVLTEAMHPAGFAHGFEHNSVYLMDAGHIAVEVTTMGIELAKEFNPSRYGSHEVGNNQVSEILAQAGALLKSRRSPIPGGPRKVVLWGTSASSFILTQYLAQAHEVFRLPGGGNIYDGFMPTSNGSRILPVDEPMIQMPTQHEFMNVATSVQDGDQPGGEFRVYEFTGIGHLMARHNPRMTPQLCRQTPTTFPLSAYFSVALHHLLEWVDKGTIPPRADRVLVDRNTNNDGSLMVLDAHGNPVGGIRNPYVDVPVTQYIAGNTLAAGQDQSLAAVCRLSVYEVPFSKAKLQELYGTKENYVRLFEENLNQHEEAGWSLPVYHDLIMADAMAVEF